MEAIPGAYGDYVSVEEVSGPLSHRGSGSVVRIGDGPPRPCHHERYRSVYLSDERLGDYVREHKGKNNRSGVKGFAGPCTVAAIPFDIDRETTRGSEVSPDWERAIGDARRLLETLKFNHDVDLSIVQCALTGGRGVHLRIPAEMVGGFEPSEAVPSVVREIALGLAREAQVEIDASIYDRTRLLRVPNSRHKSGKYCVPIYAHELLNMEVDELLSFMDQPRGDVMWVGEAAPAASLVELKETCEGQALARPRRRKLATPPKGGEHEIVAFLNAKGIPFQSKGSDIVIRCPTGKHEDNEPSFCIERESGIFHCFGCGVRGNWPQCQQLIDRCAGSSDNDADGYRKVADAIYTARQKKGRGDSRKDFEINKEVTSLVLKHLHTLGRFYTDGRAAYFFFETKKRLVEISGEDDRFRLLLHRYGINPTETIYRWLLEALRNQALAKGRRTEVHRLAYYDPARFTVYVYDHNDQVFRISCDRLERVDNGTDGVLFLSDARAEPFERVPVSGKKSRLAQVITSKINFADDALTPGERQRIFELWFYSIFFGSIMPTKPIVAFIGPKGSGKSITLRKVGMLLFGSGFDVTPLSNDSRDFDAAVTNSPFVAFDNADRKCAWLNDRLATVSTGGIIKKRELYTTNRLVEIPARCVVGITARTPHFRRDDVADRLLIMKVERFDPFVSEKLLLAEVMEGRDETLSEVIGRLQLIVRALHAEDGVGDSSAFRMADFADFATKVARHEGWEEQLKRIFRKLGHEQSEFTLEGDPIFETLSIWVPENVGCEMTYKELWSELKELAGREGIDFDEYENNYRGFVRRMPNIRSNLEAFFDIKDIPRGGHRVAHTFRPKQGE